MFWYYGPQAPTAFSNGPPHISIQSNWIAELLVKMRESGKKKICATAKAEQEWVEDVRAKWYSSLCPPTDSWYQGANIPGKIREPLNYLGGIPAYIEELQKCANNNYQGFELR